MESISVNTLKCETGDCKPIQIPTDEEVNALNVLRNIKKRVRELKKLLKSGEACSSDSNSRFQAERELLQLKKEWHEWEDKREHAAHKRMVALGHIKSGS